MSDNSFIKNPHLEGDDFFWQGNSTGFLLIHGFTATTAEVRLIADKLHQLGYTIAAPLLPGHGTHPDDLNRTTWPMWVEKVKAFYERLLRNCEQVYVIGQSMGTLLAIELAAQHPEIPALILTAPALKVHYLWVARFISPIIPYVKLFKKDDGLPWRGYTVYPLKAAVEFQKLQKHTWKQLPKITQPTLIFTAEYDHHLTPDSIKPILEKINSEKKKSIHLKNSGHGILLDQELELVLKEILTFTGLSEKQEES